MWLVLICFRDSLRTRLTKDSICWSAPLSHPLPEHRKDHRGIFLLRPGTRIPSRLSCLNGRGDGKTWVTSLSLYCGTLI